MFDTTSFDSTQFFAALGGMMTLVVIISLWSAVWKGIALWYAARRGEKAWYILMLILNTAGILEIIYIFAIAKRSDKVVGNPSIPPTPPTV